jgi:hypothetical protein
MGTHTADTLHIHIYSQNPVATWSIHVVTWAGWLALARPFVARVVRSSDLARFAYASQLFLGYVYSIQSNPGPHISSHGCNSQHQDSLFLSLSIIEPFGLHLACMVVTQSFTTSANVSAMGEEAYMECTCRSCSHWDVDLNDFFSRSLSVCLQQHAIRCFNNSQGPGTRPPSYS